MIHAENERSFDTALRGMAYPLTNKRGEMRCATPLIDRPCPRTHAKHRMLVTHSLSYKAETALFGTFLNRDPKLSRCKTNSNFSQTDR